MEKGGLWRTRALMSLKGGNIESDKVAINLKTKRKSLTRFRLEPK